MALTKIDNSLIDGDFTLVGIRSENVAFSSSTAITPDLSLANFFTWSLDEDKTLNLPSTNPGVGIWYILITQDGTGGWSISLDSNYNIVGNSTLDETLDVSTLMTLISNGTRYDIWFQSLA